MAETKTTRNNASVKFRGEAQREPVPAAEGGEGAMDAPKPRKPKGMSNGIRKAAARGLISPKMMKNLRSNV